MAVYKCKMCGGTIEVTEGQKVVTCEYCGATQTVHSFDNEKKITFFKRAEALRFKCEFDKAAGVYETIVSEFPREAEAYWGLVLCKYGIEYVDDSKTGKKIPTCHRTQFASIYEDADYLNVLKYADVVAKSIYEKEAKEISKLQKSILDISSKEDPFDIFICYKENDIKGNRTKDSVLAQDIYDELISKGYRVFFSRITLEDKLGTQYEPYIFAALHSAKVMLHITTSDENSESVWVRNEWSRFLSLIADGQKKTLIPCYKDITAYDLPEEMQNLQGQDMSKLGAMQDLLRGVEKILNKKTSVKVEKTIVEASGSNGSYDGLIKKGHTYLRNHKFDDADRTFDEAIRISEMPGEAYLGKVLAEYQFTSVDELMETASEDVVDSDNYVLAKEFANDQFAKQLKEIEDRLRYNRLKENYDSATRQYQQGDIESLSLAIDNFKVLGDFEDSPTMVKECIYKKGQVYLSFVKDINSISYCENATKCFEEVDAFKNSHDMINLVASTRERIVNEYKESCINKLSISYPKNVTNSALKTLADKVLLNRKTIKTFNPLYEEVREAFKNIEAEAVKFFNEKTPALIQSFNQKSQCSELRQICRTIETDSCFKPIYDLIHVKENELNEIAEAMAKKRRKKTLKVSAIVCGALAVAVATFFGIKAIVDENNRKSTYASAANAMETGNYDEAIAYYESLGNYQESQKKIKICEGLKQLEASITSKKEADAVKGIKTIVSAGEKVDVAYETENNVNIKRLAGGGNSGNKTETIDNVNFTFYQPTWNGYSFLNWNSDSLSYKDNRTHLGLMSNWSLNSYSISYVLDGGTNNTNNPKKFTVESPDLDLFEPSKEHYHFKGWRLNSASGDQITKIPHGSYGDKTLYATWEIYKYDVKFYNEDVLLETVKVDHGGTAVYSGTTPTKEKTAEFSYTFSGWDKPLTNITQNTDVYAQYDSSTNSYRVTFYDYDRATVLDSSTVEYGSNAVFTKATPTRATDDQYEYTFSGWDKPLSTPITGDTDFYAEYSTKNRYLCRFFVDDVETYSVMVTEGENVTYQGEYPTREQTQEYVFDFMNWDKSLENIQEDTDFNAVFNYIPREYEVKYVNWDGTVLLETQVAYGCYSSYSGNTPARPTDNDYVYTFSGWDNDPSETPIVGDTVFTAQFSTTNRYLCLFVNYDGSELYREYVTEGENAAYSGSLPTKPATQQYTYAFSNWDKPLNNIQSNTTFTAQFSSTVNQYTVTFVNWDGSVLGSDTVDYGSPATFNGSTPTRPMDNTYKYTFSGWDISLESITANVTATAQYSTEDRFLCRFYNDGTLLYSTYVTDGEDVIYVGDTPTREKTQQYTYTFSGWDKPLENINEHTDFNAEYNSTVNTYAVFYYNWDGTVFATYSGEYGSVPPQPQNNPTREDSDGCYWVFSGWDCDLSVITDNINAHAVYTQFVYDAEYTLNDDGESYSLTAYNGTADYLDLAPTYNDKPITKIGNAVFKDNTTLKTIKINKEIEEIGEDAFNGCSSLNSVRFKTHSALTRIGDRAFVNCDKLRKSDLVYLASSTYGTSTMVLKYYQDIILPASLVDVDLTKIFTLSFEMHPTSLASGYSAYIFTENSQEDGRDYDLDSSIAYGYGLDHQGYSIACHYYVCYAEQWHYASNNHPMPMYWCNNGTSVVYENNPAN